MAESPTPLLSPAVVLKTRQLTKHSTTPAVTYRLHRAASVTGPWSNVATNTAPASGLLEYHETAPPPGSAFYRAVRP